MCLLKDMILFMNICQDIILLLEAQALIIFHQHNHNISQFLLIKIIMLSIGLRSMGIH